MIRIGIAVLGILVLVWIAVSVVVELESEYVHEELGGTGAERALVLFHPSRDARFSDDLSLALAEGLKEAGFSVERATITRRTPGEPGAYALIAVVSNTYYWTPDLPTLHYLGRARLGGIPVVGVIGGAGATGRSERMLAEALRDAGGTVLEIRSFWLWRPNDEDRMNEPNRQVAMELAKELGRTVGRKVSTR